MKNEIEIGCLARAEWSSKKPKVGVVTGTSHNGTCWVLETMDGLESFHKNHCMRISSNEAGKGVRQIKQERKAERFKKARASLIAATTKIFGDGDI